MNTLYWTEMQLSYRSRFGIPYDCETDMPVEYNLSISINQMYRISRNAPFYRVKKMWETTWVDQFIKDLLLVFQKELHKYPKIDTTLISYEV